MQSDSDIGTILDQLNYTNRRILYTTRYILHLPIKNNMVNGVVNAYLPYHGTLAWTCTYENSVAVGTCKSYNTYGQVISTRSYIDADAAADVLSRRCAEYVLA